MEHAVNTKRLVTATVGVTLLLASFEAGAIKLPRPPATNSELSGVWVGFDDARSVIRLELDKSGHGILLVRDENRAPSLYKVTLNIKGDFDLSFALQPTGGADNTFTLSGTYLLREIKLERHYAGQDWNSGALLLPESMLQSGIQVTKTASSKFRSRAER
jgi:hypothetical protein